MYVGPGERVKVRSQNTQGYSAVQSRDHWDQLSAATLAGELINLSGDFNHDRATSTASAALAAAPAPHVHRASGATHQSGSNLDGFWSSSVAGGGATSTPGMTGDHWGQQMTDMT